MLEEDCEAALLPIMALIGSFKVRSSIIKQKRTERFQYQRGGGRVIGFNRLAGGAVLMNGYQSAQHTRTPADSYVNDHSGGT